MKKTILNRASIRKYKDSKLDLSIIDDIKDIVNSSPTSTNQQRFSVIFIQDQNIRNIISEKNAYQEHIKVAPLFLLFLVDCNRTAFALQQKEFDYDPFYYEDDFVTGVIDATIASAMVQDYCLSQKLGVCYIGGVKFYGDDLCKLLNIEGMASPILGMTIGYPDENPDTRPKDDKVFYEVYSKKILEDNLVKYNETIKKFYKEIYPQSDVDISFFDKIHEYYLNYKKIPYINNIHYKNTFLSNKKK